MIKILQKLDDWIDKKLDSWDNKNEVKKWNKLIKKACKKHYIQDKRFVDMYLAVQKEILEQVNNRIPEGMQEKEKSKNIPFNTIIKQKIYDLNREFILLINGEFHNSAFALTRQIIEIYIRLIQCRYEKKLINKLMEEERQKSTIKNTIEELKKKVKFSYVREIDSQKFLDSVLNWFNYFSNFFHLSGIGLSQNMWIFNEEKNLTRLYIEDPVLKEGELLMIFSKKAVIHDKQYFTLIHQFYTFTDGCLKELKLLGETEGVKNE